MTLPTKPSQTTTCVVPLKMSLPSTLPTKLSPDSLSSSAVRFTTSLPLMSSSPILRSPIVGPVDAFHGGHQRTAHDGKLDELLGRAVDVGAQVQHRGLALLRRQLRSDRRTVDAGQRLEHEASDGHQCAGIAGGYAGLRRPVLDQVDRDAHRRILLLAQRVRRRLVHRDDFTGRVDRHAIARRRAGPRQRLGQRRLQSDQDHARVGRVLEELERCRDGDREAGVASHRINGNRDGQGHVGKKPAGGRRRPWVQ